MNVQEALAHFMRLHPKEIDLSLDRMRRLLSDLGNPERTLPPVIHIAGTNGKGSTLAVLRSLFQTAGQRVHAYTSPHLVRFAERIRIANELPNDDELAKIMTHVAEVNGDKAITFFEATTAAALYAFSQNPADVCLLETGLGGRLDATNVVQYPETCVLSPIAMDHQDYLGDTLGQIASEKAHIVRPNTPTVIAPQLYQAREVIRQHINTIGAHAWNAGSDWSFAMLDDGRIHITAKGLTPLHPKLDVTAPPMPLIGPHQALNAALAVVTAHASGMLVPTDDLLAKAIPGVTWPGRMQNVKAGTVVERLGQDIWLDGGHNPAAAQVIAPILRGWAMNGPIDLILGMQTSKDTLGYIRQIAGYVRNVLTVPVPNAPAPMSSEELAQHATDAGCHNVKACENWQEAMDIAKSNSSDNRTLLVSGSLYLVGDVLSENGIGAPE